MVQLNEYLPTFKKLGASVVGISADPPEESRRLVAAYRLAFPLLSDPKVATASAYGVAMQQRDIAVPALFVIDQRGAVHWRHVAKTMADRPHSATLIDILKRLSGRRP